MMKRDLALAYDLGQDFSIALINVSENQTFRIDCHDGRRFALRLARPHYHTPAELQSEVAWLQALKAVSGLQIAAPVPGRNGQHLQQIGGHNAILFAWASGAEPLITSNLLMLAQQLGQIAAKLHNHVEQWSRPEYFTRPRWDFDAAFGTEMRWGDWRNGLGVEPAMVPVLGRALARVQHNLAAYGTAPHRFNLIHGDLRLANLLVEGKRVSVIDFDDCGFGWLMYDAATMISFHEHEPQAADMIKAWQDAYRQHRPLTAADEKAISTLIIFRRILLTAWLGSHAEIDLARQLKPHFAAQTTQLCEAYLTQG